MRWFESRLPGPEGQQKTWRTVGANLLDAYIMPSGDVDAPWSLLVNVNIPCFGIYRQKEITRHATVMEAMGRADEVLSSLRAELQEQVDICDKASGPHQVTSLGDKGVFRPFKED